MNDLTPLLPPARTTRRTALTLLAGGIAAASTASPQIAKAAAALPRLATPEQIEAERVILSLLPDPALKQLQATLAAELATTPRGKMPNAAARLNGAIAQWTNSLLFGEISNYRAQPAFLWGTDDTPRTWLGHTLGGVGTSGDNPDAIYRSAVIDGGGQYEILGQIDLAHRPAQFQIEADAADMTQPAHLFGPKKLTDTPSLAITTDRQMNIAPDGSFRITVNGPGPGSNNLKTPSGRVTIGVRDILSDWTQRAALLRIRRLDTVAPAQFSPADIRTHLLADLPGYIRFWSAFPDIWMGGLKPNSFAQPKKRPGGWGFVAGLRFQLAPDEAAAVTTTQGPALYTGFQIIDPWMIAPDARRHQCCLNLTQATPDADGAFTYVIAQTDPGVANWLDTTGLHDGFGIMRWQNIPADMTSDGLIRDYRVIKLADAPALPGIARITPEERRQQLAARVCGYNSRTA